MIKTITITQLQHEMLPSKSGQEQVWRYTWQIVDEKHQQRYVAARIIIDSTTQQISRFQAANIREMPLVDALLRHRKGDCFTIDFTDFNQKHCYDSRTPYSFPAESNFEKNFLFSPKDKRQDQLAIEVHGFL